MPSASVPVSSSAGTRLLPTGTVPEGSLKTDGPPNCQTTYTPSTTPAPATGTDVANGTRTLLDLGGGAPSDAHNSAHAPLLVSHIIPRHAVMLPGAVDSQWHMCVRAPPHLYPAAVSMCMRAQLPCAALGIAAQPNSEFSQSQIQLRSPSTESACKCMCMQSNAARNCIGMRHGGVLSRIRVPPHLGPTAFRRTQKLFSSARICN